MMHMMHYTMICPLTCQYQYLTRVSINICVPEFMKQGKISNNVTNLRLIAGND